MAEQEGLVIHPQILLYYRKLIVLDTVHYRTTLDLFSYLLQSLHRSCMEVRVRREHHLNNDLSNFLLVLGGQTNEDVQMIIFQKDEGLRD